MSYDGSRFVAIDNDAVAGNSPDVPPLDEFVADAIFNNLAFLDAHPHAVSFTPLSHNAGAYTAYLGERPLGSMRPSSVLFLPWLYQRDLDRIEVSGLARAAAEDSSGAGVTLEVRLYRQSAREGEGGEAAGWETFRGAGASLESKSSSPPWQDFEVSVDGVGISSEYIAPLALRVRSSGGDGDPVTRLIARTRQSLLFEIDQSSYYQGSSAAAPNPDSLETQYSLADSYAFDHLANTDQDNQIAVTPSPLELEQIRRYQMGYVQLRGLELAQGFRSRYPPSPAHFEAGRPVLGETEMTLPIWRDNIHRRARPVWIGPTGERPDAESGWPANYRARFTRAPIDGATHTLIDASLRLTTPNPRLLVLAYFAPLFDESVRTIAGSVRRVADEAPVVPWRLFCMADRLENGMSSWSEATDLGTDLLPGLDLSDAEDPNIIHLTHLPILGTGDDPLGWSEHVMMAGGFPFREGQLFAEDEPRLHLHTASFALSGLDQGGIIRTRLLATAPPEGVNWNGARLQDAAKLRLVCVGATIWEVPQ